MLHTSEESTTTTGRNSSASCELPGYGCVRDRAYRWFADHRTWFGSLGP